MFKRYKNPFEKESSSFEVDTTTQVATPPKTTPYSFPGVSTPDVPPRINEEKYSFSSQPLQPLIKKEKMQEETTKNDFSTSLMTTTHLPKKVSIPPSTINLEIEEPDTTLGEGVVFKGQLTFKQLLRIDGHFEGDLLSDGKLIVGPTGVVKSNIKMKEAIIEGIVEGNMVLTERLELRSSAKVFGNIEAKYLSVDEGVSLNGHVAVEPTS